MDLIQSTAVIVPVPITKFQSRANVVMVDGLAAATGYQIMDQEGNMLGGGGTVAVNAPFPGFTNVRLVAGDLTERGTSTIFLVDAGNNVISTAQIDAGFGQDNLGIQAGLLDTTSNYTVCGTALLAGACVVSVGAPAVANLGPYMIQVIDHAGNMLGSVYGRIVAAGSGGLTQADVRTAIGLSSANLDGQLAAIVAAIATRAAPGAAMTLTAPERDAVANALLDLASAVETGCTPRQALRLLGSALGGVIVQTAPGVWQFKGAGVATARITASIPGDGSRPSMTLTL